MKPTLFAPVTLTALLVWGCGGNVAAPISQQADSVQDAAAAPAPDAHLAFDFDSSIPGTPVPPGSPDAGGSPGDDDAASGSPTDAPAPPPDAAPQGMADSGAASTDATPPQPAPADATVPPSPPADASSSDDAAAYADVSISDDTGPGNSGPPATDSGTMMCLDDGKDCSANADCCTGLCLSFGSCGACIEVEGLCLSNSDCCDGQCNLQTNACM